MNLISSCPIRYFKTTPISTVEETQKRVIREPTARLETSQKAHLATKVQNRGPAGRSKRAMNSYMATI